MTGEYLTRMESNLDDIHDMGFQEQLKALRAEMQRLAEAMGQAHRREGELLERVKDLEQQVADLANTCLALEVAVGEDEVAEA